MRLDSAGRLEAVGNHTPLVECTPGCSCPLKSCASPLSVSLCMALLHTGSSPRGRTAPHASLDFGEPRRRARPHTGVDGVRGRTFRVTARGTFLPLQLFLHQNPDGSPSPLGWGVRCTADIAAGTFVGVYTGVVAVNSEVPAGGRYAVSLDHFTRACVAMRDDPAELPQVCSPLPPPPPPRPPARALASPQPQFRLPNVRPCGCGDGSFLHVYWHSLQSASS